VKYVVRLKVHKNENFVGSDFECCAQILRFCKKYFLIRPLLGEIRLFRLVWSETKQNQV
jgi:hypothetical protein